MKLRVQISRDKNKKSSPSLQAVLSPLMISDRSTLEYELSRPPHGDMAGQSGGLLVELVVTNAELVVFLVQH